jgi:hypothetical protein
MSLPEDVPKDLLYMQRCYQWLYSKYGSDLQAAATEGNKECQFWQLESDFGRAHYEVEQMKKWFTPILDLKY